MIEVNSKRNIFRGNRPKSNPARLFVLLVLLMVSLFVLRGVESQEIKSPFLPTPTPTRIASSFGQEGEVQFYAGNIPAAIAAYQRAVQQNPQDAQLLAELARIQTYSYNLLTTDPEKKARLQEALDSINQAVKIAPDDSNVHAIRAFVLDWNAALASGEESTRFLNEAEQEATRAIQLDPTNPLALAYYAEILIDQQKWDQADQNMRLALQRGNDLMDIHRINGYYQESIGNYEGAIEEYAKAVEILPNFTPLYVLIGTNYRTLGLKSTDDMQQKQLYTQAIEQYAKAVKINNQLGVVDPIPYLAIAKTYSQMGEFFAASLNVQAALDMLPENPDIYAQLGIVYFKARNYEGAIPALKCALEGCNAKESCEVRQCNAETSPQIEIQGMELSDNTLVYYYTYGSVLAGMHRKSTPYCEKAVEILGKVRDAYQNDTVTMQIIDPSVEICASYGYSK